MAHAPMLPLGYSDWPRGSWAYLVSKCALLPLNPVPHGAAGLAATFSDSPGSRILILLACFPFVPRRYAALLILVAILLYFGGLKDLNDPQLQSVCDCRIPNTANTTFAAFATNPGNCKFGWSAGFGE